jgi:hypothetical protein
MLTRELQASIPKYEQLAVTAFPTCVTRAMLVLAAVTPIIVAMAYISFRTMSQGNRILFIAGIVVLELSCWLWYGCTIPLSRRPIRWGQVVVAGIAACITQFAWKAMVSFALTGHALSHDLASAGAFLLIPAFFAVGGFAAVMDTRRAKPWLELDIAQ